MLNTKRKYIATWIEGADSATEHFDLSDIIEENKIDYEYLYAIRDDLDKILDLKEGQIIHFQFNRDNKDSQGVIKRIK